MQQAIGVDGKRNWIAGKLQSLSGAPTAGMYCVDSSDMVSLAQRRNLKTVPVKIVRGKAGGGDVRPGSIGAHRGKKLVVDEKLDFDALRLIVFVNDPSFDSVRRCFSPSLEIRRNNIKNEAHSEPDYQQSFDDRLGDQKMNQ